MTDLIADFGADYYVVEQISPKRRREQTNFLHWFERWLDGAAIATTTDELVRDFMREQIEDGLSPNTVRWKLNMLRSFFKWCWRRDHIDDAQWLRLRDVDPPRGATAQMTPNPYSRAELARFWEELDAAWPRQEPRFIERWRKGTSPYRRVMRHAMRLQIEAIVGLMLHMGLRRKEVWLLELDDMHPDNAYVVVRGKRDDHREKLRKVPYSPKARAAVIEWFRFRRWLAPDHDRPWLSLMPPTTLTPMRVERFNTLLSTVGEGWCYHRFRHTFATERLRAGMKVEILQKILGHANIQQTLAYTKIEHHDLAKSMDETDQPFVRAVDKRKEAVA